MTSNVVNQVAFLRTSREFPEDLRQLSVEVNKTYIDTSAAVNARTIGLFPVNRPAINGENWFLNSNKQQQGLRQVYTFTTTSDIPLGFKLTSISQFTKMFGVYTDATNWYGLIAGTSVAIPGQLIFYVALNAGDPKSDVIKFVPGGGGMPAVSNGTIVLEWISHPVKTSM